MMKFIWDKLHNFKFSNIMDMDLEIKSYQAEFYFLNEKR